MEGCGLVATALGQEPVASFVSAFINLRVPYISNGRSFAKLVCKLKCDSVRNDLILQSRECTKTSTIRGEVNTHFEG